MSITPMLAEWELHFINTFVKPASRERWLYMHEKVARRTKLLGRLYHHFDFQAKSVQKLSVKHGAELTIIDQVTSKGAGDHCYLISALPEIDGRVLSFDAVLASFGGMWPPATVCICVPQRLALFHDEYDLYLLEN